MASTVGPETGFQAGTAVTPTVGPTEGAGALGSRKDLRASTAL